MNKKITEVSSLIGNSPLFDFGNGIYAKLEYLNPSGSIKDRMVSHMLEQAEKRGDFNKSIVIVEATSGNTGIALSMLCAAKGYKAKIYMPHYMSEERKAIMRAYGSELILTENMDEARELASNEQKSGCFFLNQFKNDDNIDAHYTSTGQELLKQLGDIVPNAFVAGIGTGGTIMGIGRALKEKFPDVHIVGTMPQDIDHNDIEGIGCYYQKEIVDPNKWNQMLRITNEEAFESQKILIKQFGLFAGVSSGANYLAAQRIQQQGYDVVVTILPDSADRYISKLVKRMQEDK